MSCYVHGMGAPLPEASLQTLLQRQHDHIEQLMTRVLDHCREGEDPHPAWSLFRHALLAHLDAEDAALMPALATSSAIHTRALHAEHRHLRARLASISAVVASGELTFERGCALRDELRAHTSHEADVVAGFEESEPSERRDAVLVAIASRLAARSGA